MIFLDEMTLTHKILALELENSRLRKHIACNEVRQDENLSKGMPKHSFEERFVGLIVALAQAGETRIDFLHVSPSDWDDLKREGCNGTVQSPLGVIQVSPLEGLPPGTIYAGRPAIVVRNTMKHMQAIHTGANNFRQVSYTITPDQQSSIEFDWTEPS